jgi:hypothetical protein
MAAEKSDVLCAFEWTGFRQRCASSDRGLIPPRPSYPLDAHHAEPRFASSCMSPALLRNDPSKVVRADSHAVFVLNSLIATAP